MIRTAKSGDPTTEKPQRPKAGRFRRWRDRNMFNLMLLLLIFLFFGALSVSRIFVQVPAGHVGVLWARFGGGTVTDSFIGEGVHVIWPWNEVYLYDSRLQTIVHTYDTISSSGMSMNVEIATRFRVNRGSVGTLHQLVGPDYPDVLINPEIGSHARELIARYTPEQLYTEARAFIQAQILNRMVTQLGSSLIAQGLSGQMIYVEDILIRSVALPDAVVEAIERKEQQYHVMLEYDFRLEREEQERRRKNIEALGIREFQEIVSGTITDEYLRLRGIDATLAIASSNNAKIIVMGGSDGLPVILNTGNFDGGGGPETAPSSLEEINSPLAPNAALSEIQSTNAIQSEVQPLNRPNTIGTPSTVDSGPPAEMVDPADTNNESNISNSLLESDGSTALDGRSASTMPLIGTPNASGDSRARQADVSQ
jgi:prohibitin 2